MAKVPKYVEHVPVKYRILCRGKCSERWGVTRWARLNLPYPGAEELRRDGNGGLSKFQATCLKCGYVASDNYNWFL